MSNEEDLSFENENEGEMFVTVRGGAFGCCGGDPSLSINILKSAKLWAAILVIAVIMVIWLWHPWDSERLQNTSQWGSRNTMNRMATVNDLAGHTYNGLGQRQEIMSNKHPLTRSPMDQSNHGHYSVAQRERLADYDKVTDIPSDDTGDCSGHVPTTSDDELYNKLGN